MKQEDIRTIIATYELPPKLEERILNIALRQHEEEGFAGFTEMYQRVSHLVDRFKEDWKEKSFVRLDDKSDENSSLHERIGGEDSGLVLILDDETENDDRGVVLRETLDLLQTKIDLQIFTRMHTLFETYFESHLDLTSEQVVGLKDVIEERAKEAFACHVKEGKLMLPRRPIKRFRFTPELEIEFGKRKKGALENPLQFFQDNIDFYGGMSRTKLQKVDSGLYHSLRKAGQLSKAIHLFQGRSLLGGICLYRGFKDPLTYYQAHPELHDLTRGQLCRKDKGLYSRLLAHGQLETIPLRSFSYKGFESPFFYFQAHPELHDLTREKLCKKDRNLYFSLCKFKQLEEAIPYAYCGFKSPLAYFQAHKENYTKIKNKEDLMSFDSELYNALSRCGLMDKVFSEEKISRRSYKGFSNPLEYFRKHPEKYGALKSKKELNYVDSSLCTTLFQWNLLDEAFPKKPRSKRDTPFKGYVSPLDYFRAHEEEFKCMTRSELSKKHSGLYWALMQWEQMDEAIAKRQKSFRHFPSATAYFEAHRFKFEGKDVSYLIQKDKKLWYALYTEKVLDKYFPAQREDEQKVIALENKIIESLSPSHFGRLFSKKFRECSSPLDYFITHKEKYQRIKNRGQLSYYDNKLYRALKKWGQIEEVFPMILRSTVGKVGDKKHG